MDEPLKLYIEPIALPPGTLGMLDWPTGVIHLNADEAEFAELIAQDAASYTERQRDLAQTLFHERFHYLQIGTCGFLYQYAGELFEALRGCGMTTENLARRAQLVIAAEAGARLVELHGRLESKSAGDVSIRSMVESHAHLVEKRSNWVGLDASDYDTMIRRDPPDYHSAYRMARSLLGPVGFELLPVLVSVSLCSLQPVQTYAQLLAAVCADRSLQDVGAAAPQLMDVARDLAPERFLGTAADVRKGGAVHPVYAAVVDAVTQLVEGGAASVWDLFARPHMAVAKFARVVDRPIALAPQGDGDRGTWAMRLPDGFAPSDEHRLATATRLVMLASLSYQLLAAAGVLASDRARA